MKAIYTNLSPINLAYTNLNHLFYLKKQNPQKVYICIWDSFIFENQIFEKSLDSKTNKEEKLQQNIEVIEKLMSHLDIDYKIISLSEAMSRLFRNSSHLSEFQNILANITIGNLKKGFDLSYIPFHEISLSRINYIVADALIATYLPELFPEICSSQPTHYLTSERFKVFQNTIGHCLKSGFSRYSLPKSIFVTNVPVIMHPDKKVIPSLEMSSESIKSIVDSYYKKLPSEGERYDLLEVLSQVLSKFSFKDQEHTKKSIESTINNMKPKEFLDFITTSLYNYFSEINKITSKIEIKPRKKNLFIAHYDDFNNHIKSLNKIKVDILNNCNGNNTSLDISKRTGLKLSTVSTYLTQMKQKKLIDNAKRPKRLVDSFVIDLEVIGESNEINSG